MFINHIIPLFDTLTFKVFIAIVFMFSCFIIMHGIETLKNKRKQLTKQKIKKEENKEIN